MIAQPTLPNEVVDTIEEVVRAEMDRFGLDRVTVTPGEDHDGDPILLIEAHYRLSDQPVEPKVMAGLATKLRDRLWSLGETRFPHVRHHFAEQQKVVGFP